MDTLHYIRATECEYMCERDCVWNVKALRDKSADRRTDKRVPPWSARPVWIYLLASNTFCRYFDYKHSQVVPGECMNTDRPTATLTQQSVSHHLHVHETLHGTGMGQHPNWCLLEPFFNSQVAPLVSISRPRKSKHKGLCRGSRTDGGNASFLFVFYFPVPHVRKADCSSGKTIEEN